MHFVDHILVWGKLQDEHDKRLKALLARVIESGLTFNPRALLSIQQNASLGNGKCYFWDILLMGFGYDQIRLRRQL